MTGTLAIQVYESVEGQEDAGDSSGLLCSRSVVQVYVLQRTKFPNLPINRLLYGPLHSGTRPKRGDSKDRALLSLPSFKNPHYKVFPIAERVGIRSV
jgi:hypothetical protein